jgi:1-acyl-sn-glycerol-3-phosphate acyltransferase
MKVAIKGFIDGDVFKPKAMIVSNHISYIDILVISSLIPTVFVTSFDVKQQFFLGFLSRLGSSIFVDRRPMRFNPHQIIEIAKVMVHSCSVSIFPEATSSDGTKLLPFKSSLFEAALKISGIIQPAVIRYSDKSVAYYGNHNFFSHFWNLLGIRNTDIVIEFLPVLKATEDMKRHELCKSTYKLILSKMEAYNATI